MKIKSFLITFIGALVMLIGSSYLLYVQLASLERIDLQGLTNTLYEENTKVLAWSMKSINTDAIGKEPIPESWAEIMVVSNKTLSIIDSTSPDHIGLYMYKIPSLLDQASPIINGIKSRTAANISTKEYMVSVLPIENETSLIGLKPKAWEKGLLSQETGQLNRDLNRSKKILIIYLLLGLCVAIIIAVMVSITNSRTTHNALKSFEELSLGNFDIKGPSNNVKDIHSPQATFQRLKTSLIMALERLGEQ